MAAMLIHSSTPPGALDYPLELGWNKASKPTPRVTTQHKGRFILLRFDLGTFCDSGIVLNEIVKLSISDQFSLTMHITF